jgi:hypothetical protein
MTRRATSRENWPSFGSRQTSRSPYKGYTITGEKSGSGPWRYQVKGFDFDTKQQAQRRIDEWIGEAKRASKGERPKKTPKAQTSRYKGYRLVKTEGGWTVPQLDSSVFDDKTQAKRFVDAQRQNPHGRKLTPEQVATRREYDKLSRKHAASSIPVAREALKYAYEAMLEADAEAMKDRKRGNPHGRKLTPEQVATRREYDKLSRKHAASSIPVAREALKYAYEAMLEADAEAMKDRKRGNPRDRSRFARELSAAGRKMHGHNPHVATMTERDARAEVHELKGYGQKEWEAVVTRGDKVVGDVFDTVKGAMSWARIKLHELATPAHARNQAGLELIYGDTLLGKDSVTGKLLKKLKAKPRRNPEEPASELFEVFHGFPSEEVLEYMQEEHHHDWLFGIGPLVSLEVMNVKGTHVVPLLAPDPAESKFDQVVQVAANEMSLLARLAAGEDLTDELRRIIEGYEKYGKFGDQLFFVGGCQELPLEFLIDRFGMTRDDIRERMLIGTVRKLTYRTRKTFEKEGKEEIDFWHKLGGEHSRGVCPVLIYKPLTQRMELAGGRYFVAPGDRNLKGVSPGIVG